MTQDNENARTCAGCNKLSELDGRLVCLDHRSIRHYETITYPGKGYVWKNEVRK